MTVSAAAPAAAPAPMRGVTRLVRIAVLGGLSLLLGTSAHLAGGGPLPATGVLVVTALLLGLTAVTLTARRCRFRLLVAALTASQVLLHLIFNAATNPHASCTTLMTGMGHVLSPPIGACDPGSAMSSMTAPGWSMCVAHLVAPLLTAGLLARGEAWLWRVADRIVQAAAARPSDLTRPASARPVDSGPRHAAQKSHSPAAPRGPPVGLLAPC